MKVLVIGSGGREHAIVWKLAQSKKVTQIYSAPGNGGIAQLAECVHIPAENIDQLVAFAKAEKIDLTVVGPEQPLSMGIVDIFEGEGLKIFGPSKAAARIEASKSFAKGLMEKYNIPTARSRTFTQTGEAIAYVRTQGAPIVVKADGLAAGKGVTVAMTVEEACAAIEDALLASRFGEAGSRVVIEDYLEGEEASVLAFTDGKVIIPMVPAQDHKRIFDGDQGPNTGGMGTYAPAPVVTPELMEKIQRRVLTPIINAMRREGYPYKGVLYAGLMITPEKEPMVIEFNARLGDPETQVVLPLLKTDLLAVIEAILEERLDSCPIEWHDGAALCVVLSSEGYPAEYRKGDRIDGLEEAAALSDVVVFHAGTKAADSEILTSGGRVLGVTGIGKNLQGAQAKAYQGVERIRFHGVHFRKDIGYRALKS